MFTDKHRIVRYIETGIEIEVRDRDKMRHTKIRGYKREGGEREREERSEISRWVKRREKDKQNVCVLERERETYRQTDRQTDTQVDRHREIRDRDINRDKQKD